MQEQPSQTTDRKHNWKVWHSCNYMVGGFSYLIGSVLLFSYFAAYPISAEVSGWIYTVGSFTFLLADLTQWQHYLQPDCKYFNFIINFFINAIGSFLYLLGSIFFIPQVDRASWGLNFFIVASFFIIFAQVWKIFRTFSSFSKSFSQIFQENKSGLLVDFLAGFGALMYFSGSFVFKQAGQNIDLINQSALIYTLGGLCFALSGCFIQYRYFYENTNRSEYVKQEQLTNLVTKF